MADFLLALGHDFSLHLEVLRKAAKFETRISSALFFCLQFHTEASSLPDVDSDHF